MRLGGPFDEPRVGELDGVADEVEQDLADVLLGELEDGELLGDGVLDAQVLGDGAVVEERVHLVEELHQVAAAVHVDLAGLELGEVEDVVDE